MEESVCCILFNKEKNNVLLIKRRDIPVWVLPGGGIEKGETPEAAAIREAEEETGFKVNLVRKVAFYIPANRLTRHTHFYEFEILEGAPRTGEETREINFFPLDALPETLVPVYKTWIDDALEFSPEVFQKKIQKTSYWLFIRYLISNPILMIRFLLTRMGIHINH